MRPGRPGKAAWAACVGAIPIAATMPTTTTALRTVMEGDSSVRSLGESTGPRSPTRSGPLRERVRRVVDLPARAASVRHDTEARKLRGDRAHDRIQVACRDALEGPHAGPRERSVFGAVHALT